MPRPRHAPADHAETGTSLLSRLKRAGYEDTAEAKLGLKRTVSVKAVDKHQLLAGFVASGSYTATGSMAGFSKDLTHWIGPTAPTEALVVVLIGFPDLEPEDDDNVGPDGATANECIIVPAHCTTSANGYSAQELCFGSYTYPRDGQCPSDYPNRVKQIQHCLRSGIVSVIPEAGTSVSAGTSSSFNTEPFTKAQEDQCKGDCGPDGACVTWCETERSRKNGYGGYWDIETRRGILSMNNTPMANYVCEDGDSYYDGPNFGYGYGEYRLHAFIGPNEKFDAVCCN